MVEETIVKLVICRINQILNWTAFPYGEQAFIPFDSTARTGVGITNTAGDIHVCCLIYNMQGYAGMDSCHST